MGRLVTLTNIETTANWYFDDAYYSGTGSGGFKFKWPNDNFPHQICIHEDDLHRRRPTIRRWIENTISDTVIFDSIDKSYTKYYGKSYEWDKSYNVCNTWHRFSFENEHSASMFALAFSEWIKTLTAWHPTLPEDEEYLNRPLEDRYIK